MKFETKRSFIIALFALFALALPTQTLHAGFFSRIKNFLKFEFFGKKKKPKVEETIPLPDPGQQDPEQQNAAEPPRDHPPVIDIQQVVGDIQSLAAAGPEIYTLLVNDSVGRLLDKAEQYLDNLKWGSRVELVDELNQRMIHQKPKASMLLQMNIWRTYIDSPMPLKNYIQDITREEEKLIEYQAAISQLVNNEWLRSNKNLFQRVEKLLVKLETSRTTLQSLDELTVDLLDIRTQAFEPTVFRLLKDEGAFEKAVEQAFNETHQEKDAPSTLFETSQTDPQTEKYDSNEAD